jgi:hypothetical protein
MREALAAQLRTSGCDLQFEFRTLAETNLYRGLYPTLAALALIAAVSGGVVIE